MSILGAVQRAEALDAIAARKRRWVVQSGDRRARNEENRQSAKRQKLDGKERGLPVYATQFSKEELENETKKPKRKVAVMIGYSGSGYKGMQLSDREKTIEGDLFRAFVDAGAISKANADDPKKISLVRCARTDKGVHAAGNLISLKMIIEDENIVEKINQQLSPQIRVFGIERTNSSFSAYQFCDSRIYEYLIPTHCFLPPHPDSYFGQKLDQLAGEANDLEAYRERQSEVSSYWADAEERFIKPIFNQLDPSVQSIVRRVLYEISLKDAEEELAKATIDLKAIEETSPSETRDDPNKLLNYFDEEDRNRPDIQEHRTITEVQDKPVNPASGADGGVSASEMKEENAKSEHEPKTVRSEPSVKETKSLESAIRQLKTAYITAKKSYRIDSRRLERIRSTLSHFVGTHNFHNYTIEKPFRDPSAKRVIKSLIIAEASPLTIGNTEWLSLKVHGQSFMMHQIRKMVSMAALIVRCGACPATLIPQSYSSEKLSIPKAPGLGLLLERPVFDMYNEKLAKQFERAAIDFGQFDAEMQAFKQREIYERIFREEEEHGQFHSFFNALDNAKHSSLLYLSSLGPAAVKREDVPKAKSDRKEEPLEGISSDEDVVNAEDG